MLARITMIACLLGAVGAAHAQDRSYLVRIHPITAPKGFEKVSISKAAVGSTPIRVWSNAAINPDCTVMTPGATLSLVSPPSHGSLSISDEPFYQAYPPANPRSACNDKKVPGHQAFYTAAAGYTGRDRLVLQGSSPEGRVRQITVDINVR